MELWEAVATRIWELSRERGISPNELAERSEVTQTTMYHMMTGKNKNPAGTTLSRICSGLEVELGEFFSSKEFKGLEQSAGQ